MDELNTQLMQLLKQQNEHMIMQNRYLEDYILYQKEVIFKQQKQVVCINDAMQTLLESVMILTTLQEQSSNKIQSLNNAIEKLTNIA